MNENQMDFHEQFATVGELPNGYAIKELNLSEKSPTYKLYEDLYTLLIESPEYQSLGGKTQVLDRGVNDTKLGLTTRKMHDMHVSQNAMKIALKLFGEDLKPEDLEAVMLAKVVGVTHDLGHTPFGHDGEEGLRAAISQIGDEYTFSHEMYSYDLVLSLIERFNQRAKDVSQVVDVTQIPEKVAIEIANGSKNHVLYYDYQVEKETPTEPIPQKCARLADSLSFMVTDLYDLVSAGITNEKELIDILEKNGVEIDKEALDTIFKYLHSGGEGLRQLHELLIDEAFKPNRRGTYDLRTSIIDDYKYLQEITDSYVPKEEMTNEKRVNAIYTIARYAEYLEKSKNSRSNPDFWKAMMKAEESQEIGNMDKLKVILAKIEACADKNNVEFTEDEIRYIDAVITETKEPIQTAKKAIQKEEMEACPTLMTLFIMQDEIQYKEILRKAPERLGNDTRKNKTQIGQAFENVLKLAFAAQLGPPYTDKENGEKADLSKHKGELVPDFHISKDGKATNFKPLRYAVYCIQQMKNEDFKDDNYLKDICEELGIEVEKIEEILQSISLSRIYRKCRIRDGFETPIKGFTTKFSMKHYKASREALTPSTPKTSTEESKTYVPDDVSTMTMEDEEITAEAVAEVTDATKVALEQERGSATKDSDYREE